ncbi:MAG: AbrB/MazE/SpoVT family DNA-binding domain-containing protein [Anaerolineales bacterium]|nr:AbrB/MazE/SpoVT family DNA-binding domain-containing protein [Anaerolineales bacterium]
MNDTTTLQMGQRGVMTFPKSWREQYRIQPGDQFTLLDIGGVFVLSPVRTQIDALADQITQSLVEQGESLEDMLLALREERERYNANS